MQALSDNGPLSADPITSPSRRLTDAKGVGRLLGCSERSVYRLADRGVIPWGVKLGTLRRWDTAELEEFLANGCRLPKGVRR